MNGALAGMSLLPPLLCAAPAAAQSASLPLPGPPAPGGLSIVRVDVARPPAFTVAARGWVPTVHVDIALGNSAARLGVSATRFPALLEGSASSLGGGLSLTQVVAERQRPAWMAWVTGAAGVSGLRHEGRSGMEVVDAAVAGGAARLFRPGEAGKLALSLAPRLQWRRMGQIPGIDPSTVGGGATAAVDWASGIGLGALAGVDLEWLSRRPPGERKFQTTVRVGISYRRLVF